MKGKAKTKVQDNAADPTTVRDMLLLADIDIAVEVIAGWSAVERYDAQIWATMVHLDASDNDVRIPAMPACVARARQARDAGVVAHAIVKAFLANEENPDCKFPLGQLEQDIRVAIEGAQRSNVAEQLKRLCAGQGWARFACVWDDPAVAPEFSISIDRWRTNWLFVESAVDEQGFLNALTTVSGSGDGEKSGDSVPRNIGQTSPTSFIAVTRTHMRGLGGAWDLPAGTPSSTRFEAGTPDAEFVKFYHDDQVVEFPLRMIRNSANEFQIVESEDAPVYCDLCDKVVAPGNRLTPVDVDGDEFQACEICVGLVRGGRTG